MPLSTTAHLPPCLAVSILAAHLVLSPCLCFSAFIPPLSSVFLQLYMNCIDVAITNSITPAASQQVTGKRTVFANQPGYPTIPEFGLGYDGSDIYAAAPTITITASGNSSSSGAATPSASASPAAVVVASASPSPSRAAAAASPSATGSRSASASASRAAAAASPAAVASVVPSGSRILDYLHARGEALDITTPAPVKAVYADYRDSEFATMGILGHWARSCRRLLHHLTQHTLMCFPLLLPRCILR